MPDLVVGQSVRVRLQQTAEEYYDARVIESLNDDIFIDQPLHSARREPLPFIPGRSIWVEFRLPTGALARYRTPVIKEEKMPVPAWQVQAPKGSNTEKEQRREHVRVSADLEAQMTVRGQEDQRKHTVAVRDISGGGAGLLVPPTSFLHAGNEVELNFVLPKVGVAMSMKGVVVRVSDRNEKGYAAVSVRFEDVKEADRQKIIQYAFQRQRLEIRGMSGI